MFATAHYYELYSHWWDWLLVPVVFIYLIYSITHWLPEKSATRLKAIGPLYVGYILLLCLVSGAVTLGWRHGYYNTPQNTPYETHTGGIWHDSAGHQHLAPTEYTHHDENSDRRQAGVVYAFLWGIVSLCLFVLSTDLIYLVRLKRRKRALGE